MQTVIPHKFCYTAEMCTSGIGRFLVLLSSEGMSSEEVGGGGRGGERQTLCSNLRWYRL